MALNDLQLLELVDRAQEARKGEPGPQGIGIREIRSVTPTEIVVVLTDGRTFSHTFPAPADGEPGPAGRDGVDSIVPGPRGPKGEAGEAGRDGRDGVGIPGTSVDSALVDSRGHLLIGLTDGQVIDSGRVIGPAGVSGERGPTGLAGAPGKDGAQFLAGEHPPSDAEDGRDGDMWMDLSSPQMDVFGPKKGGAWGPRRFMAKQPPAQQNIPGRSFLAGGGSSGSGGQPPFDIQLPAGVETEIGRIDADQGILLYRVNDAGNISSWSAGQVSLAAMSDMDDSEFTIASELKGVGGDFDLIWRVSRVPGNLRILVIHATAPADARITGRIVAAT